MQKTKIVYQLPIDPAGYNDMCIKATASDVSVTFGYGQQKENNSCLITFAGIVAFRFHDEMHTDIPEQAGGAIVEIEDSEWLKQLKGDEPSGIHGVSGTHHFATFLNDHGYLEVIADECRLIVNGTHQKIAHA
jgi:hypothetical protein